MFDLIVIGIDVACLVIGWYCYLLEGLEGRTWNDEEYYEHHRMDFETDTREELKQWPIGRK